MQLRKLQIYQNTKLALMPILPIWCICKNPRSPRGEGREGMFWVCSEMNSGKRFRFVKFFGGGWWGFWVSPEMNSGMKVRLVNRAGGHSE